MRDKNRIHGLSPLLGTSLLGDWDYGVVWEDNACVGLRNDQTERVHSVVLSSRRGW